MGLYKYINNAWKKPTEQFNALHRTRLIEWRREEATKRIDTPTRLDKARQLGYKAKTGYAIVRQRVDRGGRRRLKIRAGRKTKHARHLKILHKNYQSVAEERTGRKYPNMEVLNSYFAGKDGLHYWYEVILVDKQAPEILADNRIAWIAGKQNRRRALRGLTASARRTRGLLHKGIGAEKLRPSRTAKTNRRYKRFHTSYQF